ncbi:DUF775-domain-containing protein [Pleurotus eryngii]|uniref:DUF775-domain-containing protein n=1 Tax=Pleurotus eryngii TaxID=5323 RepID=A0A9P6A0W8_PLEER|nr:DUF775-domain-containing protein [Pleurotus eryngii]
MFGCVVAGRLLQTNLQQVDETHAYFELSGASTINHISVFLLGTVPFPEGYGALSNEKPSAIFRLRGNFTSSATNTANPNAFTLTPTDNSTSDVVAILGLAIEPLDQIQVQVSGLPTTIVKSAIAQDATRDATLMAERVVKHLFNYLSSFVGSGPGGFAPDVLVPMGMIAKWYDSFLSKVKAGGIGFLERGDS